MSFPNDFTMFSKLLRKFEPAVLASVFFAGILLGGFSLLLLQNPSEAALGISRFAFSPSCTTGSVQPVFSPGADGEVVGEISRATNSIDIELYQFSFADARAALVDAVARGVKVRLILEPRVDSNYGTAEFLSSRGVDVRWANKNYSNTHSKFAVFDSKKVLVGSINWSMHAMKLNREAAVIVEDAGIARDFSEVFEADWNAATPFKAGGVN